MPPPEPSPSLPTSASRAHSSAARAPSRDDLEAIAERFRVAAPPVDFWSIRVVAERDEGLSVRRGVVDPPRWSVDTGVMITIGHQGGLGYAATADVTRAGLERAAATALDWAIRTRGVSLIDPAVLADHAFSGDFTSPVREPWDARPLGAKLDLLRSVADRLHSDPRIVDWSALLWRTRIESLLVTSAGSRIAQTFEILVPMLSSTANEGSESQTRTLGGYAQGQQGGLEVLETSGFLEAPERVAAQALELLAAPDCPTGVMDLVLAPDQMVLQIHESIGHPLELDRILGDERNYAGRSFVTREMFGSYQYGSPLLNVTFDPTIPGEIASFAFDDEGTPARKEWLIRDGILVRGLGGVLSQRRSGVPGVSTARAEGWARPPIDRMANLNLEPGASSLKDMIAGVERGVWMETNCSWSIDDSRNKFQFGCELGRVIENGALGHVVKKPNYRGVSATFWRNLKAVGAPDTVEVLGSPYCGKGEPNQIIRVGHATPPCLFSDVEVFGGV